MKKPFRIFYSYSHKDKEYMEETKEHLAPLFRKNLIENWYDRMIPAGTRWETEIAKELETADVFLMLVSSSFLASNYCFNIEMARAIKRANDGKAIAIPVIIRECLWELTELVNLKALPEDGIPINSWPDRDKAFKTVAEGLLQALQIPKEIKSEISVDEKIIQNLETKKLPYPLVVGRKKELRNIFKNLMESQEPIMITSGYGGIGKSTLALKTAWDFYKNKGPFNFIAWVNCRTYGTDEKQGVSFIYILNEIARAANKSDIIATSNLAAKKEMITELFRNFRSLLIFDNYESLLHYPKEEEKLSEFLEYLQTGLIHDDPFLFRLLITTRELSYGLRSLRRNELELEKMPENACVKWMKKITPKNVELKEEQYKRIWELLNGLPKYIEIAIAQLGINTFEAWERMTLKIAEGSLLVKKDTLFDDLFKQSWSRFIPKYKKVLLSISYFIGDAPYEALQFTSGFKEEDFYYILESGSKAYHESTGSSIRVHPLTYAFCRKMLNSKKYAKFREESNRRFIDYYHQYTKKAFNDNDIDAQERQIRNIVVAVMLAEKYQMWNILIDFRTFLSKSLRHRGFWYEERDISASATTAYRELSENEGLARSLVYDLGWIDLRLEEIGTAENEILEGLKIFKIIGDKEGISQATRHLGKAALIKGLDQYYIPRDTFDHFSIEAERYYKESLYIREILAEQGLDQRQAIADMYLDFGRLYWLQGLRFEQVENINGENVRAYQKYQEANEITIKAQKLFEEIGHELGIVKSWGNLGNSTKQIVRYALKHHNLKLAKINIEKAHEYYVKNAEGGVSMGRKDEISHGYWGLAEVYDILAENPQLHNSSTNLKTLLEKAHWYAVESHKIYTALGGSRDIDATHRLVERLSGSLKKMMKMSQQG